MYDLPIDYYRCVFGLHIIVVVIIRNKLFALAPSVLNITSEVAPLDIRRVDATRDQTQPKQPQGIETNRIHPERHPFLTSRRYQKRQKRRKITTSTES